MKIFLRYKASSNPSDDYLFNYKNLNKNDVDSIDVAENYKLAKIDHTQSY